MSDICVIVPAIRRFDVVASYIANAKKHGFDTNRLHWLLVTEDHCDIRGMKDLLDENGASGDVMGQSGRDEWFKEKGLGEFADIIPKKSHAETSFGLLWMWSQSQFKYGIFIDDDTFPIDDFDYFGTHIRNLEFKGEVTSVSSDKNWVNVFHESFQRHGMYPRGYPYSCMEEKTNVQKVNVEDVAVSQGLWTKVPDLDAVRILIQGDLTGRARIYTEVGDFKNSFVVEPGNYTTVCSMNLAFKREVIPAFYQLPMDDNKWKIGRFDDIWSGIFIKKACDLLGKHVISGFPLCEHDKASRSTFKDLNAEVPALELNEHLWEILDNIAVPEGSGFHEIYVEFAKGLKDGNWSQYIHGEFLNWMADKMMRWLEAVDRLNPKI